MLDQQLSPGVWNGPGTKWDLHERVLETEPWACSGDSRCHRALFQAVNGGVGGQPAEGLSLLRLSYIIRIEHQAQRR